MHIFLSHNHLDEETAARLAAQLRLAGADVWLDDWKIRPGDAIPGKVSDALAVVDTVAVLWSEHAAKSRWVAAEFETAIDRSLSDGSVRVVPIRLDVTELPALLRALRWIRIEDPGDITDATRGLMGLDTDEAYRRAVQQTLHEAGIEFQSFEGYGPAIGCLKCGAPVEELRHWTGTDFERDDQYAGVECTRCGWQDGGEI